MGLSSISFICVSSRLDSSVWSPQFEHARFKNNSKGNFGHGFAIYIFVEDIDATLKRVQKSKMKIIEELAENPNAGFREFTFLEPNGYHFTVAEIPSW
ncbi:MAG: VOC family protein [Bdellovibrionales bacterium]